MVEKIYFPEELIPEFVAMVRRGLADETNARIKRNTEMQLKELERYHKDLNEEEVAGEPDTVQAQPAKESNKVKKRASRR